MLQQGTPWEPGPHDCLTKIDMAVKFRIPKLTDREIALRLNRVRLELKEKHQFQLVVSVPHGGVVPLPEESPDQEPKAKFAFDLDSQVIQSFQLKAQNKKEAFVVRRQSEEPTDIAELSDEWVNNADDQLKAILPKLHVQLLALTRSELQAPDTEASLTGASDSEWNRYRDAQTAVLNSLQQANETLILRASEQNAELDKQRSERFEKLEAELRTQLDRERSTLDSKNERRLAELDAREKQLDDREASFETKESHYVARQKQAAQIEQIQGWLEDWKLTAGTSRKRWPVAAAYAVALIFTGVLTLYASWHSFDVLRSADEIVKLAWWQWVGIWAKSIFPLAAFATFMIYAIRWSGDWARQHSEEEFRNRTRLVDIGRSSWLLETVRDAQERNKEIPPDLLKELSRNLFATNAGPDSDLHPKAISDLLMQGLSSVRLKSPDGAEVEATREKSKKR